MADPAKAAEWYAKAAAQGQVNLPNNGNVADSQDPIPITQDDRPVSGGGSTGPQPNDPEAMRLNGFLRR